MSSNNVAAVSAFIEGAPPGELADVVNDVKALTPDDRNLLESARPAFKKYNEEQLTAVKLPGGAKNVLISAYNSLEDGRYYDVESRSAFAFDHMTQKASDVRSYVLESEHKDLITSLLKPLTLHAHEHYPSSVYAVYPTDSNTLAILLAANKYSPSNFWNGRLRTTYLYTPSTSTLSGTLKCDVHYYEDGNVRLTTKKEVSETSVPSGDVGGVVRAIAKIEKAWQEELNRGFGRLSEGEFKSLRRQLPVTRQKVEWEKVGSYRAGKEIGGGRR
ncbi:F-actin-capping protein subunit alpha [Lepraria neglecta]|uniref:F-actin-capping protein subunit alpha n=1 Tax=Lepraria neglecta TaxID=209136 RepID=A0AAD9ZEP3_9LECA|nr:F-actin-capping protein subunit alpha [Lepraria neglecta]